MPEDDRTFQIVYEEAKKEVDRWPSWMRDEVVDIYSEESMQDDFDDTFDE